MKRDLSYPSISKIYIFLGIVSVAGIFLLFFDPQKAPELTEERTNRDFINQVLVTSLPIIKSAWNTPSMHISARSCGLPEYVGEAFLECHPRGWSCLWQQLPHLEVEYAGKKYQLKSTGAIEFIRRQVPGIHSPSGYVTEVEISDLKLKQKIFLPKTCHEMYLPQRTYAYGEVKDPRDQGIIWDNAGRKIFIDKFYVSEGDVHEWKKYLGEEYWTETPWKPALLNTTEQKQFCSFHGKQRLMAHFFDASQMTPTDLKISHPDILVRPDTPWQRDYNRTFFAKAQNDNFTISQMDCSRAQVKGCQESYFMTDSVSWSGVAFGLGFEEEQYFNPLDLELNVKKSSRQLEARSEFHRLGRRVPAEENKQYAFRCFREVL